MRQLLNVLYVTSPDAYLAAEGNNIVIQSETNGTVRRPVHIFESVVSFGYRGASPALMRLCSENGVMLSFVSEYGKFLARVSGRVHGNILLRKAQYRMSDDEGKSLMPARNIVFAKLLNARAALRRLVSDYGDKVDKDLVECAMQRLKQYAQEVLTVSTLAQVRGIEGEGARDYFSVFDQLILFQKDDFYMRGRNRRPPTDCLNTLLSFLYTLLAHDAESALETVGLDPYAGFLHRDRPGRASLALDMVEEFRTILAERTALTLINRRQITAKEFICMENGAVLLEPDARKGVLEAWQKRKQEEIAHPFLKEKMTIGLLPYAQALLMARFIRGDINEYPPFLWK
ncbi:MAG: type I-C CRISPR-associated endonuclease Cas1c [Bacillota bacterium]